MNFLDTNHHWFLIWLLHHCTLLHHHFLGERMSSGHLYRHCLTLGFHWVTEKYNCIIRLLLQEERMWLKMFVFKKTQDVEQDFHGNFQVNVTWFFAFFSGVLDWIVPILVWFETLCTGSNLWQSKLMMSQVVERMWICTGGYQQLRGKWVNSKTNLVKLLLFGNENSQNYTN